MGATFMWMIIKLAYMAKALIHKDIKVFLLVTTETLLKHFYIIRYFYDISW